MIRNDTRETRIKRLYYRSWHRGCKETDLLMGRFADAALENLSDEALSLYEALLEEQDSDIWKWYSGALPLPREHDNAVWAQLRDINERAVAKQP